MQMKVGSVSLTLQLLLGAQEQCPHDPAVLNELGVAYYRLDR